MNLGTNPRKRTARTAVLIALVASLLFVPFNGAVHLFDWDEINFAECAREMIVSGDYTTVQINFRPFWEKPPLYIWFQVAAMKVFGVNEFAARLPNALAGIVILPVLFLIGNRLYNRRFGLLWVLAYGGSVLPLMYFKSGIIDPWFNFFIFLALYFIHRRSPFQPNDNTRTQNLLFFILAGLFTGMGVLTKGPVALLMVLLVSFVLWALSRFRLNISILEVLFMLLALALSGGFWFILQILSGNTDIVMQFIEYQVRLFSTKDAGHGGFLLYHFVVLFVGVFPASGLLFGAFSKDADASLAQRRWLLLSWILLAAVLLVFTIVRTKIVHYSSLAYFPVSFLAAYAAYCVIERKQPLRVWVKAILLVQASLFFVAMVGVQFFMAFKQQIVAKGLIKDQFAVGNLAANVHWSGFEWMISLALIPALPIAMYIWRKQPEKWIPAMFLLSAFFSLAAIGTLTGRVEGYSQRAAVEFFKAQRSKDCFVIPSGYKSYAHLFYSDTQPANAVDQQTILESETPKDIYVAVKNTKTEQFERDHPDCIRLYAKNGFGFYLKKASVPIP